MAELKDILKKLRTEKNMSQAELAQEIGAGVSTVAMWEVGKRYPTREKFEALADIFNVDIDYLYGRTEIRQRVHFDPDGHMMVSADLILNDDERLLIEQYRKSDSEKQEMIRRILAYQSALLKNQ